MSKLLNALLIFSIVFTYADCFFGRNSFDGRVRICNLRCIRDEFRTDQVQNCLVLLDRKNITVTQCLAQCLERKGESLANAVDCECRNHRCLPPTTTTTTTGTTPAPTSSTSSSTPVPNAG